MPSILPLFCRISADMPLRTSSRQLCVRAIEWLASTFTPVFSDSTASSTRAADARADIAVEALRRGCCPDS